MDKHLIAFEVYSKISDQTIS